MSDFQYKVEKFISLFQGLTPLHTGLKFNGSFPTPLKSL